MTNVNIITLNNEEIETLHNAKIILDQIMDVLGNCDCETSKDYVEHRQLYKASETLELLTEGDGTLEVLD